MTLGYNNAIHKLISTSEFIAIPDNPRQRNTQIHLKKANKYLSKPSPAQMVVHVASLPNGVQFKLDGHTRAMYWAQNPEQAPSRLNAIFHPVESVDEALVLYMHFDNAQAAETKRDVWTGAFRQIGFSPNNSRLQRGEGGYPLSIAHGGYMGMSGASKESPYTIAPQWKEELLIADQISEMGAKEIHVGIWASMFATFKKDGRLALPFWIAYFNRAGISDSDSMDAVQYLLDRRKEMGKTKATEELRFSSIALGCYRRWKNGTRLAKRNKRGYQQHPDPITIANFLSPMRKPSQ